MKNTASTKPKLKLVSIKRPHQPQELPAANEAAADSAQKTLNAPISNESSANPPVTEAEAIFQAIGIIQGDVNFDGNKPVISVGGKNYTLWSTTVQKRVKVYQALKKEIESSGNKRQTLIVYPKIVHYPTEQPYTLEFELVGFVRGDVSKGGISAELEHLEFKISGLWQFIPVCRVPCVSVFKNFSKQRLDYIKTAPLDKRINFMKASHLPVVWRNAPVSPFRFNPKLDKESQGKAFFVQIKAKFNSDRNVFEFVSLFGIPSDSPPNYLKACKEDKLQAAKTRMAALKTKGASVTVNPPAREKANGKPKLKLVAKR